ncbi:cAMP and cAMP-inhibited cGMP 3',5'-cyclic phosphodiesterase 10A-like, partial [Hetaerina americana]|uniref:cAMP and cAMP-inhibited cGMP 3',5'-cyclic phosphodiesterase 10A-like n=1 Tax=Hetaerina americana TaxID=62018 RepID=UPI003A7F2167
LGALTVVNKVNGPCFSSNDEISCDIWAKCLAVICYYIFKKASLEDMDSKSAAMEKMLMLNLKPNGSTIEKTLDSFRQLQIPKDFFSFAWFPWDDNKMHLLTIHMLKDTLDPQLAANDPLIVEFVLTVLNSYRRLPYHNFQHAVVVTHCAYIILKTNPNLFDQIEVSAIMVSAICHDSDHLGMTNSFLMTTNHALSKLYEKSQLENRHYYLAAQLIQEMGLFQHLNSAEYGRLMDEIKYNIIATDLAVFLERRRTIMNSMKRNASQLSVKQNRLLMKSILMTACDLSSNCKPFSVVKEVIEKLCEEYYLQGDKEKELGLCPVGIMDRDLHSRLPEEEVNFYSAIVLPCYSLLTTLIPNTEPLYDGCL